VVNGDLRLIIKKKGRETEKEHFWCSLQSSNLVKRCEQRGGEEGEEKENRNINLVFK